MAKKVSGKTHTRQQLNDDANQHNPNNKAFRANAANTAKQKNQSRKEKSNSYIYLGWECFGWCDD